MPTRNQPFTYAQNELNPASFGNFNYGGDWMQVEGGYRGVDNQGAFWYTPFQNRTNTGGAPDGPGHWTQDGGWMADPVNTYGQTYTAADPSLGVNSPLWAAQYGPDAQLVNLAGNTNLPGLNSASNLGWGYLSRTAPPVVQHSPAHSSFDLIADLIMPVVGSAIVGGAGALGAGAGATGAGAAAGAEGAIGGLAGVGAGAGTSGLGTVAGLGSLGAGLESAWGVNPSGGEYDWLADVLNQGGPTGDVGWAGSSGTPLEGVASSGTGGVANSPNWFENLFNLPGGSMPSGGSNGNNSGGLFGTGISAQQAGSLLSSILGLAGSNAQSNALQNIQNQQQQTSQQFQNMGAPYRAAALGMLTNPDSFYSGPNAQSNLQGVLQGLSVNGNPFGNPTSLALAQQGQRGLYNSTLGLLGQLGGLSGYNQAGASSALNTQLPLLQAQAQGNQWNALGAGLNSIVNPQPTLAELVAMLRGQGGGLAASNGAFLPSLGGGLWNNDENQTLT